MKWGKAGRPSSKPKQEEKPKWLEQEWTKEELSIISATEKSSLIMLGIAVIKQWIRDGKPKAEFEGIKPWLHIITDSLLEKNNRQVKPALPADN